VEGITPNRKQPTRGLCFAVTVIEEDTMQTKETSRETYNKAVIQAWEAGDKIMLAVLAYYAPREVR
jgi:riboflavin synthase alpha subunit